jgi:hypothetical protein
MVCIFVPKSEFGYILFLDCLGMKNVGIHSKVLNGHLGNDNLVCFPILWPFGMFTQKMAIWYFCMFFNENSGNPANTIIFSATIV